MDNVKILWVDDEIDTLKPQLFFLNKKGYDVITISNGYDGIERLKKDPKIDIVFLDESMPGISGLETLEKIKEIRPFIPIVMITKNETENIMEEAIGSQIDDYLIKPVNPNQILLSLKKIIDNNRLVREKTSSKYREQFREIISDIGGNVDHSKWVDIYMEIIKWELKLNQNEVSEMTDILSMQKNEANSAFFKFISNNYHKWLAEEDIEKPILSHQLMKKLIFPKMEDRVPTVMILLDNLRFDQWKTFEPLVLKNFRIEHAESFYSILPTTTQYSRNAIFAGLLPNDISKKYPEWWLNDFDEGGKNNHEEDLLREQINRMFRKDIKFRYAKVVDTKTAKNIYENVSDILNYDFTVLVYNFIDMLSHARTELNVLKALASDEKAYRSITLSWFKNSPLYETLEYLSTKDIRIIITTDHGTIRVKNPSKVIGDKNTTSNLRYKMGKNLQFNKSDVFSIDNPEKTGLPSPNVSSKFIFAKEDKYFLYPNNYNYYSRFYNDTFQHGGISMEEVICPCITLRPRKI